MFFLTFDEYLGGKLPKHIKQIQRKKKKVNMKFEVMESKKNSSRQKCIEKFLGISMNENIVF